MQLRRSLNKIQMPMSDLLILLRHIIHRVRRHLTDLLRRQVRQRLYLQELRTHEVHQALPLVLQALLFRHRALHREMIHREMIQGMTREFRRKPRRVQVK